ncbi:MAG: diguanylate cyclase [Pseudomonadota bacterium]
MQRPKLSLEEILPLMLSVAGAMAVAPFAVIRLLDQDWLLGIIDVVIVFAMLAIAWLVYRYRAVRTASVAMATLCLIGLVATLYTKGPTQTLWAYPALMAVFYLLKPREAIVVALGTIAILTPVLIEGRTATELATLFITLWVTLAFSFAFAVLTAGQRRQLRSLAHVDPLTGAGNRRALAESMPSIISETRDRLQPTSLLMLDLDHFKQINDRFGHSIGDQVLVEVADCLREHIRPNDQLFRIGGEEFVVVALNADIERGCRLGESLRHRISQLVSLPMPGITVSLGVAELVVNESADDWFRRADAALYDAKRSGRNRVCAAFENQGVPDVRRDSANDAAESPTGSQRSPVGR